MTPLHQRVVFKWVEVWYRAILKESARTRRFLQSQESFIVSFSLYRWSCLPVKPNWTQQCSDRRASRCQRTQGLPPTPSHHRYRNRHRRHRRPRFSSPSSLTSWRAEQEPNISLHRSGARHHRRRLASSRRGRCLYSAISTIAPLQRGLQRSHFQRNTAHPLAEFRLSADAAISSTLHPGDAIAAVIAFSWSDYLQCVAS